MHGHCPLPVDEMNLAPVFLLRLIEHDFNWRDGQTNAGGPDKGSIIIKRPLIDENGHGIMISQVTVDIDYVVFGYVTNAEVPFIADIIFWNLLQNSVSIDKQKKPHSGGGRSEAKYLCLKRREKQKAADYNSLITQFWRIATCWWLFRT